MLFNHYTTTSLNSYFETQMLAFVGRLAAFGGFSFFLVGQVSSDLIDVAN